jgi:hypothetical protein
MPSTVCRHAAAKGCTAGKRRGSNPGTALWCHIRLLVAAAQPQSVPSAPPQVRFIQGTRGTYYAGSYTMVNTQVRRAPGLRCGRGGHTAPTRAACTRRPLHVATCVTSHVWLLVPMAQRVYKFIFFRIVLFCYVLYLLARARPGRRSRSCPDWRLLSAWALTTPSRTTHSQPSR